MFQWIRNHFLSTVKAERVRRFESAETNRLNQAHWQNVGSDEDLNKDLNASQGILRQRSTYESTNNPTVDGMINTDLVYLIGADGPKLQVQSEDEEYNNLLEIAWKEFWAMPDINGELSGTDMLRLWVRTQWTAGEFLSIITSDPKSKTKTQIRLQNLHPKRLASPYDTTLNDNVVMGVKRSDTGKPEEYYISKDANEILLSDYLTIPAVNIIHGFEIREAGQSRGIPWLSAALQSIADLRDYDVQVLDAARSAADLGVVLTTNHPDAEFIECNEVTELKRREQSMAPPGWAFNQVTPTQPMAQYVDYRDSRVAEFGRPVGMPLMMIMLDSRKHNYSSARFDAQVYLRGLKSRQGWLERKVLDRLVKLIEKEISLSLPRGLEQPEGVDFDWTWPVPPHVDPQKEGMGERISLENYTSTRKEACALRGKDWDAVVAQLEKEKEQLEDLGLPFLPGALKTAEPSKDDDEDDDDNNNKEKDEDAT